MKLTIKIFSSLLLLSIISFVRPQFVFAATPTISNAGIVTSYSPWAVWVNGSNLTNPLRVRLYDNTATYWADGQGVAYGSGNISFSLPSNMPPNACNYSGQCGISFDLVNNLGQASTRRNITLPQFSGYSCSRCSNNEGCTNATFRSTDTGCTNPINGTISYTANQSCPRLNPPPSGGSNNNCSPISCNRCSNNFGCTRAYFQSNELSCSPPIAGTETYAVDQSCPALTTVPTGGHNNNCTQNTCNRCSNNFGCTRVSYKSVFACSASAPAISGTEVYTADASCPSISNLPAGGHNNNCAVSCSRCSNNFGCMRAQFQTLDACTGGTSQTAQPLGTVSYVADQSCPALTTIPTGGNNTSCNQNDCTRCSNNFGCTQVTFKTYFACSQSALPIAGTTVETVVPEGTGPGQCPRLANPPDGGHNNNCQLPPEFIVTLTVDDDATATVEPGENVTLEWSTSIPTGTTCTATGDWSSTKPASGTQVINIPTNPEPNYIYYLTCTNGSNSDQASVTVTVNSESGPPQSGDPRDPLFEQTSGIIFNGGRGVSFLDRSDLGKISERSWIVGLNQEAAAVQYNSPALTTSYNYLLAAQSQTKNAIRTLECSSGICEIPTESGVYHVTDENPTNVKYSFDDPLTVAATSPGYPDGKKIVLLIDGDFSLKNTITVDTNSVFILAVKGSIFVEPSLGQGATYACNVAPQAAALQGIFTAQEGFIVQSISNLGQTVCSPNKDQMLIIDGTVITNADLTTTVSQDAFVNNRDLCENNLLYPAVSIRQRPDFLTNLPEFAKRQRYLFKELTP